MGRSAAQDSEWSSRSQAPKIVRRAVIRTVENMLLRELRDGAGNLISGSVGGMRQLRELPRISALRFGFPTAAGDAPLANVRFRSTFPTVRIEVAIAASDTAPK